jgi:hypothetical protein
LSYLAALHLKSDPDGESLAVCLAVSYKKQPTCVPSMSPTFQKASLSPHEPPISLSVVYQHGLWPLSGLMRLPRVLGVVHKRVRRERDARDEDSDILTAPEGELELAGETLLRLDIHLDNAYDY